MPSRPLNAISSRVIFALLITLALQCWVHYVTPRAKALATDLPILPSVPVLRAVSLDEPIALSKMLMLYLQAFDNQPGISIPFRDLDYARVEDWLTKILSLDPAGQYPLLSASRLYGEIPVAAKQRQMLDFVHREFLRDPNRRWPWLAHSVLIAKHQLKDLPLAARYALDLRDHATGKNVPHWAQQMAIFIREDMNELESAKVLLGGLLQSGQISDPKEWHFLNEKLKELERKSKK
jgi:hypothetical protein